MYSSILSGVALLVVLAGPAYADSAVAALVGQLKQAPTANDRLALLKDDDLVFDFNNPPSGVVTGQAGHTVEASSENFPAVIGNGVAMTIGFLGPCAINTPHTHPRATEINFSVNGTLRAGLLSENGARFIVNDLPPGTASVFPKGAVHFEMNTGCETAIFVAAFNNEDPGVQSLAQRYFGLPADIVGAALGGLGVEEVMGLEAKIPDNVAAGTDECLKRCGLTRPDQPGLQRQPRVSGNAFPSGAFPSSSSAAGSSSSTTATTSSTTTTPTAQSHTTTSPQATTTSATSATSSTASASGTAAAKDLGNLAAQGGISTSDGSNGSSTSPLLIALVVINGVFMIGALVAAFLFIRSRKASSRQSAFDSHKYMPTSSRDTDFAKVDKYEPERNLSYYDPYTPSRPEFIKEH